MSLGLIPAAGLQAQGYDFAGGLRVGHSGGLTAAVRYAKRATAEVQATTGLLRPGTTVTLLARQHLPLVIKRVNVYVGAGVHKGWDFEHRSGSDESGPLTVSNPVGIDGQAGVEVTLGRTGLAFDYQPRLNVGGGQGFFDFGAAVSLRYVVLQRKDEQLRLPGQRTAKEKRQRDREKAKKRKRRDRDRARRQRDRNERPGLLERLGLGDGDAG